MAKGQDRPTYVTIVDSNGDIIDTVAAAVSQTDGSVFTPGADSFAPIGGVRQDTPSQVADGSAGVYRMTADRQMPVAVEEALPAGDNNIGNVDLASAIPAGTNNIGDVDVASQVTSNFEHYRVDVGTSAVQLTAHGCSFGVQVKADDDNTSDIYVGKSDVTAGGTAATDGFRLKAGQGVFLPVNNANLVYCIGGAASQKVFVVAS